MQDMTIKQIAEICQVDQRTVQLWANKAGENISSIKERISSSTSTYPANYTLDETLAIIRAGGRSTLADLLAENAQRSQPLIGDTLRELIPAITAAMTAAMAPLIRELRTPQAPSQMRPGQLALLPATPPSGEYYTIKAYGSMHGVHVNNTNAVMLGREASKISRQRNIEIRRVPHEEWGEINSYHISVLKEVFTV